MDDVQLAPGNVVKLKRGGDPMTVVQIIPYPDRPDVECVWFDGGQHLQHGFFAPDSLKVLER